MANITVRTIRPTTFGVDQGLDVAITVDGVDGEALVAPDRGNGGYAVYGDGLDLWLDDRLIKLVGDDRELIKQIMDVVTTAAEKHAR